MPEMTVAPRTRALPVAVLAFVAGVSLLFLGVPGAIDAFLMLSANRSLYKIQTEEPVLPEEFVLIIDSEKQSIFWGESGRNWTDLALAQLLLAEEIGDDDEASRDLLSEARTSLKTGLALAPANPYAWTRLAYVEYLISGPSAAVAAALQMAILTAPYTPHLLFVRLELCFIVWPHFASEARDLVLQQVRLAWAEDPKRLVTLAPVADTPLPVDARRRQSRRSRGAHDRGSPQQHRAGRHRHAGAGHLPGGHRGLQRGAGTAVVLTGGVAAFGV